MNAEMGTATAESADGGVDQLRLAKSLVDHLESGNQEGAVSVIAELAGFRDSMLFQEIGTPDPRAARLNQRLREGCATG